MRGVFAMISLWKMWRPKKGTLSWASSGQFSEILSNRSVYFRFKVVIIESTKRKQWPPWIMEPALEIKLEYPVITFYLTEFPLQPQGRVHPSVCSTCPIHPSRRTVPMPSTAGRPLARAILRTWGFSCFETLCTQSSPDGLYSLSLIIIMRGKPLLSLVKYLPVLIPLMVRDLRGGSLRSPLAHFWLASGQIYAEVAEKRGDGGYKSWLLADASRGHFRSLYGSFGTWTAMVRDTLNGLLFTWSLAR